MRVLLVGFAKIKYIPYLRFYLESIPKGNEVHVIYWNRDCKEEDLSHLGGVTLHEFLRPQDDHGSRLGKVLAFRAFRRFAEGVIASLDFDLVICLHTFPAVLLRRTLLRSFKGRYIFDYRDSTYERFAPFRRIVSRLVSGSRYTFVSSDGFRRLLPDGENVITSHNILMDSLNHRDAALGAEKSERIRIAFWGFIRGERVNRALIDRLGGDSRFELHYYGKEQRVTELLRSHARERKVDNVYFHGEYCARDRYEFVGRTDIIHNVFDDGNMMIAMSNKYYDGAIFRLPQLTMQGSFMGELVRSAGIGLAVDPYSENLGDVIYDYYTALRQDELRAACDKEVERVISEYEQGSRAVARLLGEEENG